MSAIPAPLDGRSRGIGELERGLRRGIRVATGRNNWPFYAFVVLIPLQNIYSQYLPNLGGGLNFLNIMFALSLLVAWQCGGRLVRGTGVNGWTTAYLLFALIELFLGYRSVAEPEGHLNALKDQAVAVSFLFLAQMSVTDWGGIRRLLLLSLVPLPYMLYVAWDQHQAVASWHYDDALRISGTFSQLGANEFAAFWTTSVLLCLGLLIGLKVRASWRTLLLGAIAIGAVAIVICYSRTAYVAVLVGAGLVLLLHRRRGKWLVPALLLALMLPVVLPESAVQRFDDIELEQGKRDESTELRFVYWQIAWHRFLDQPLLGTGYHTFHHAEINPFQRDTHDFYLREAVEKGLIGIVVLAGMLWSIGRLFWRLRRRARTGTWPYALALGLLAAFVALLIGNLFGDRFTYYPMISHFWLYVGLALRAFALQREQLAAEVRLRRISAGERAGDPPGASR